MKDIHDQRRAALEAALQELLAAGTVSSWSDWCKKAGKSSGTIFDFLSGKTRVLSDGTLTALCQAVGKPLWWIKGETPAPITNERIDHAVKLLASLPDHVQEEYVAMLEGRVLLHRQKH